MAISVWDDGYGISVPAKYQTTKQNISEILKGFERNDKGEGYVILRGKGWDYPGLCEMYEKGIKICREEHVPVLFHIQEVTQPQGHSTSGSHERYKTKERLAWEEEYDGLKKMREWMISSAISSAEECDEIDAEAKKYAAACRKQAWDDFMNPIREEIKAILHVGILLLLFIVYCPLHGMKTQMQGNHWYNGIRNMPSTILIVTILICTVRLKSQHQK